MTFWFKVSPAICKSAKASTGIITISNWEPIKQKFWWVQSSIQTDHAPEWKRKAASKEYLSLRGRHLAEHENQSADHHCEAESKTVFMAGICRDMSEFALLSDIKNSPASKRKSNSILWGGFYTVSAFFNSISSLGPPTPPCQSKVSQMCVLTKLLSCALYQSLPVSMRCDKQRLHNCLPIYL